MRFSVWKLVRSWAVLAGAGMVALGAAHGEDTEAPVGLPSGSPSASSSGSPGAMVKLTSPYASSDAEAEAGVAVEPGPAPAAKPEDKAKCDGTVCFNPTYVSLIDSAVPFTHFRLRYDFGNNVNRPDRAEYFWAYPLVAGGGGPLTTETGVDYHRLSAYFEVACSTRLSGFIEVPFQWHDSNLNGSSEGLGDINLGFKLALLRNERGVATFQLRVIWPTGDASEGLGIDEVAIEPALLVNKLCGDNWLFEGELRYWRVTDGDERIGNGSLTRWGLGLSYNGVAWHDLWLVPVVELVGWHIHSGIVTRPTGVINGVPVGPIFVENASGEHLATGMIGVRTGVGANADFYAGWGMGLGSDHWYENLFRLELRLAY